MKLFKFFQKEKIRIPTLPRRYLGVNTGVLNAMSMRVGVLFYMEYTPSIGANDDNDIPEVSVELKSCNVTANIANIQSLNSFREENRNNYIWIHQWKLPEDEEYTLFTSDEDPDIPQDVPLVLRCVVHSNSIYETI